jgi:transcriptional regulator with XRE-family HTH domain
VMLVAI